MPEPDRDFLHAAVSRAACEVCGRHPHPARLRLALAKITAVFPVELLLHALVVHYHLGFVATVVTLTLATTALVIWVVEPSTMRLLRTWLHGPNQRIHDQIGASLSLWRVRVTVDDVPGALERVSHALAALSANILSFSVQPLGHESLDEMVLATPPEIGREDLLQALRSAGGRSVEVKATSALALVDQQTRVLALAAQVAADPSELPRALAELLDAQVVRDRKRIDGITRDPTGPGTTTIKVPSPWNGCLMFDRLGETFTPAESARAHRLAEIAEAADLRDLGAAARTRAATGRTHKSSTQHRTSPMNT